MIVGTVLLSFLHQTELAVELVFRLESYAKSSDFEIRKLASYKNKPKMEKLASAV